MPVKRYKGAKAKADKLFSEIIRSYGRCEASGYDERPCSPQLQTAHIVTRKRSATRTDLRNAFCLCFAHHRWFTDQPVQFARFLQQSWAKDYYDSVYRASITPTKVNWEERIEFLLDIQNALKEKEITIEIARTYES
jgi:hypothetical protein